MVRGRVVSSWSLILVTSVPPFGMVVMILPVTAKQLRQTGSRQI